MLVVSLKSQQGKKKFRQRSSTSRIQNYLSKLDQGNVEEWEEYEVEIELMTKSFV